MWRPTPRYAESSRPRPSRSSTTSTCISVCVRNIRTSRSSSPGPTPPPTASSTTTTVCSACRNWRSTPTMTAHVRNGAIRPPPTFLPGLLPAYGPERHDLSPLRLWTCGGAPIPAAVVERAGATLPNVKVLSLYGRSENLVTTTCSVGDDGLRALTSDGAAVPGAQVKIVDLEGNEVPRGAEGDIAYRGPAHMIEYLANPEETAALFTADRFSRSGDL